MSGWATVVLCLLLSAGVGWAQPRQRSWNDLSPGERERALQNYQEYQRLPRERQQFIDRRYQRYRELPPQERRRLHENYQEYERLPPGERKQFNRKYRRWKDERR
jgi:hypothetical protein